MKTLIICIDRDNDIGEKAIISSPVIGREANLQAALSLGIADPEDSDTNAIFGAVRLYERLLTRGEDVEVVTLAGDRKVGLESDRRIMDQLHQLVMETKAHEAILVTDGAEDEGLLNLIQSRIDVVGLERIIVKQEQKIEGLYYYIQNAIQDEKMRKIVLPLALILMAWGISMLFGLEGVMQGFIVFLVGMYLLLKTYHLEGDVSQAVTDISQQVKEGKFSWVFSTFSVLLFMLGLFRSIDGLRTNPYYILVEEEGGSSIFEISFFIYILIILNSLIWWTLLSLLVREWGKFFDTVIEAGEDEIPATYKYWSHLNISIFLIATGLFFKAGLNIVQVIADPDSIDFNLTNSMGMIILGISLFFAGRQIYGQRKEEEEEDKSEKEKRRHLLSFKRKKKISGWRH